MATVTRHNMGTQFYMPVEIKKTEDVIKRQGPSPLQYNDHCVVVETPEGPSVVNFCSSNYALLKNEDIFPQIEKLITSNLDCEVSYKQQDYCKFYVDYHIKGKHTNVGPSKFADKIDPVIRIMHSYNGQIRYKALFGFKRQICTNGLWGYVFEQNINFKHTVDNVSRMIAQTINGTNDFILKSEDFATKYGVLSERKIIRLDERIAEISKAVPIFPRRQIDEVVKRINFESGQNNLPVTDWLVYNAFNYQLNHNKSILAPEEIKMDMDKSVFNFILKNQQL